MVRLEHEYLAAYVTELSLPEYSALQWLPSVLAAAAVLVARYTCAAAIPALRSVPIWSPTLVHYTRYTCAPHPAPSRRMPARPLLRAHVSPCHLPGCSHLCSCV